MLACAMRELETVKFLISLGADVTRLDSQQRHCLDYLFSQPCKVSGAPWILTRILTLIFIAKFRWAFPLILISIGSFETLRTTNVYKQCKLLVESLLEAPGGSTLLRGPLEKPNLANLAVANESAPLLLLVHDLNLAKDHKTHGSPSLFCDSKTRLISYSINSWLVPFTRDSVYMQFLPSSNWFSPFIISLSQTHGIM